MPLDRTTEAIAHFVGELHLDVEAARLRTQYDAFRAHQEDPDQPIEPTHITISIRAPHDLKGFDPKIKLALPSGPQPQGAVASAPAGTAPAVAPPLHGEGHLPPVATLAALQAPGGVSYQWIVPPPNSIATVTHQTLTLTDNDQLTFGHDYPFVDVAQFDAWLQDLAATAADLSPGFAALLPVGQVPTLDVALSVLDAVSAFEPPADEAAAITLLRGDAASGIVVNGSLAEEMPDFLESMPDSLKPEEEETDSLPAMTPLGNDPNPFEVAPGHNISTGGNVAANEAFIVTNWVDAGVIAVAGDVVSVNSISQVAVLSEGGAPAGPDLSKIVNAARIDATSSEPELEPAAAPAGAPVFPVAWQTTWIEGDVIQANWVQQHIFATDSDIIEVMISATSTAIEMGGNLLSNLTSLVELGFHYDLIMVGGSMYSMNIIEQTMVLLDRDLVAAPEAVEQAMPSSPTGGGNYLQNSAVIEKTGLDAVTEMTDAFRSDLEALKDGAQTISSGLASDALFEGHEILSVLYISGDLVEVNVVQQINHVGDSDQVYLAFQQYAAQVGDAVTITMGENALLNSASIVDEGIDSVIMAGGEAYSDALIYQAELIDIDAVPDGVALVGLASEAVAFLASDMIDALTDAEEEFGADVGIESGHLDVMQSVLS